MKFFKFSLLLFLTILLIASFAPGCGCDDDDDDDDDGENGDIERATQEECDAEYVCYQTVDDCYLAATTVGQLLSCSLDWAECMSGINGCTAEFFTCTIGCTSAECVESCVTTYGDCMSTCDWDAECLWDCSDASDVCIESCGAFDFDCHKGCYDTYSTCADNCF